VKKSDTKSIKNNNTALVLRCLLCGAVSRAQVAEQTGLSKATVTALIGELLAKGILTETGTEGFGVGRPRTSLALVPSYAYAVGMVLHRRRLSVSLIDLALTPLDTLSFSTADFASPEEALDTLFDGIDTLCQRHNVEKARLVGIGVSAPGPLDFKAGVIHDPPRLSLFHGARVSKYLAKKTDLPVFLDNNATLLAMHERRLRQGSLSSWSFVIVTDGVGSASFIDDKLLRGAGGYAGELGHISVEAEGPLCACGNRGCLERCISADNLHEKFGMESYRAAADAAERGEEQGRAALAYVADCLSLALSSLVNLLNPEAIVLYGELNYKKELLFPLIEEQIRRRAAVGRASGVTLLASLADENAVIASSADAILDAYFGQKFN